MNTLPEHAPRVLIVDDEPDLCELLAITLRGMGLQSDSAGTLAAAKQALTDACYRLCLCDLRLPDGSGLELIEHIQRTQPQLPVAMITAHGDVRAAVAAMKAGAFDFVNKPVNVQGLRGLIDQALRLSRVRAEAGTVPSLIGDSPAMQALRVMVAKLARSQAPVFIRGESGVGKERVARLIHAQGARAGGPFVPVNCGAIPEHLLESELFGHVKGSFTGANADREGLFQTAAGGTLFLDEIGAVPPAMQVKLLRALQERAVRPVGARREYRSTRACSAPRTRIWPPWCATGAYARTSTTASTSSKSPCRRCATARRTSRPWRPICWRAWRVASGWS